jgi:hypothetical protein
MLKKLTTYIAVLVIVAGFAQTAAVAAEQSGPAQMPNVNCSVLARTGYFDWQEHLENGSLRLHERAVSQEIGISADIDAGPLTIASMLSCWGTLSSTQAAIGPNDTSGETTNISGDFGQKAHLLISTPPLNIGNSAHISLVVGPEINHFRRITSGYEDWTVYVIRCGVSVKYKSVTINAGILDPVSTQQHSNSKSTSSVYPNASAISIAPTLNPHGVISYYGDIFVPISEHIDLGVFAETWHWLQSDTVNGWNQPDSCLVNAGIQAVYHF